MSKSSPKLDEYTGDLAFAQQDPAGAVQAWTKVLGVEPKNTRVLEKVARAERIQQHWTEENTAWTTYLEVQDSSKARIQPRLVPATPSSLAGCLRRPETRAGTGAG